MTIASHNFLLIFLPLTVLLYYGLFKRPRQKMFFLLIASFVFYALADLRFLPLLFLLSLTTFWVARKRWIVPGILLNIAALILFKYLNFGIESFNSLMDVLGLGTAAKILKLGLPLGISFYVFKHIDYLMDIYRERYAATDDFWAFATYSAFFPQIIAGPLSGFQETISQYPDIPNKPKREQLYDGLIFISMGLAKKVLIADILGDFLTTQINSIGGFRGMLPAWYLVAVYSMQLYFDFSGYTDMVLGVARLLGFTLPSNFNNPYLSANPAEFWKRWHMSLSNWFNYYVFTPISISLLKKWGQSKKNQAQYTAYLSTMTLVGLWHGAGWNFIFWGMYHGLLLSVNAWWKRRDIHISAWITRPLFVVSLLVGWAFFMSPDFEYLKYLLAQMFGFNGVGLSFFLSKLAGNMATLVLIVSILISFSGFSEAASIVNAAKGNHYGYALLWGVLAALSVFLLSGQIDFLYAQF